MIDKRQRVRDRQNERQRQIQTDRHRYRETWRQRHTQKERQRECVRGGAMKRRKGVSGLKNEDPCRPSLRLRTQTKMNDCNFLQCHFGGGGGSDGVMAQQ